MARSSPLSRCHPATSAPALRREGRGFFHIWSGGCKFCADGAGTGACHIATATMSHCIAPSAVYGSSLERRIPKGTLHGRSTRHDRHQRADEQTALQMSAATARVPGSLKDPLSAALERARASHFKDYHSKHLDCARTRPPPDTACPSCGYDMSVTAVSPAFLRDGWDDVTYTCAKCGTQIRRKVRSS
jgi:hypothetical protein